MGAQVSYLINMNSAALQAIRTGNLAKADAIDRALADACIAKDADAAKAAKASIPTHILEAAGRRLFDELDQLAHAVVLYCSGVETCGKGLSVSAYFDACEQDFAAARESYAALCGA